MRNTDAHTEQIFFYKNSKQSKKSIKKPKGHLKHQFRRIPKENFSISHNKQNIANRTFILKYPVSIILSSVFNYSPEDRYLFLTEAAAHF